MSPIGQSGVNFPAGYAYLRAGSDIELGASTDVAVRALCDDDCVVYIDGQPVIGSAAWSNIVVQTLTLTAGVHHVGVRPLTSA